MREFEVRAATPRDAAALSELGRAVSAEPGRWLLSTDGWRSPEAERRYLRALRRYPDAAVFVAEAGGRIIGRLSTIRDAHPASRHVAALGLMVASDQRRRGVGRALLDEAVRWARESGIRKLELYVLPHNEGAVALYEAYGFRHEGVRERHFRQGDEYVDAIVMALDVQ